MKLFTKLFFASALLLPCFSALASCDIYLYGDVPAGDPNSDIMFSASKLEALTTKYHIGTGEGYDYCVSARKERHGVYSLNSEFPDGEDTELIFKDINAAKAFIDEFKATAPGVDKFYAEPVGEEGTKVVISIGYAETVPGYVEGNENVPPRVKIKHLFITNDWGWIPAKYE